MVSAGLITSVTSASLAVALLAGARLASADDTPTFADRADEDIREADRTWGILLNPLAAAMGVYGGEVDFALGRFAALAVEGDLYWRGNTTGLAVGAGLLVYPLGSAFHQFYFEPRLVYARPLSEPIADLNWATDVVGLGVTAGWQWTWDYGFSLRVGGGAMDYFGGAGRGGSTRGLALGPQPVLDGSLGWTF
jgi:hypothetical protein